MPKRASRREFLQQSVVLGSTLATTGFWSERTSAKSISPNEKLNIAVIGCGGRGRGDLEAVSSEKIVALADIDEKSLGKAASDFAVKRTFVDFRKLFDECGKEIDAVVVATPEHTHAVATLMAIRSGKHVYCEKPLAHSVYETRVVREEAKKHKTITQMGTQIHAGEAYRRVVEMIQGDVIGPVREAHVWVQRDWGGGERPTGEFPVPKHIHWDLWIGPAPMRPYHPAYLPGPNWYKFWDFGNGVMPDLGSHWNDLPFWALRLSIPTTIKAEGPPVSKETAPPWMICQWDFPEREKMPPVKLTWYHGGKRPKLVTDGKTPDWKDGVLFVGEKGMLLADYQRHMLLPEEQFKGIKLPAPSIPKSLGHHEEWIHACKTGGATLCNFDYSGNLTESNLLGNVAYRVGKTIQWDPVALKAVNCPEADLLIRPEYHNGWTL